LVPGFLVQAASHVVAEPLFGAPDLRPIALFIPALEVPRKILESLREIWHGVQKESFEFPVHQGDADALLELVTDGFDPLGEGTDHPRWAIVVAVHDQENGVPVRSSASISDEFFQHAVPQEFRQVTTANGLWSRGTLRFADLAEESPYQEGNRFPIPIPFHQQHRAGTGGKTGWLHGCRPSTVINSPREKSRSFTASR
jgi:hypothetical protein